MRRRLLLAFLGIALLAVVLVGAGVLLLAGVGARGEARERVAERVEALADGLAGVTDPGTLTRQLERQRDAFDLSDLEIVLIDDDGTLQRIVPLNRREPGVTDATVIGVLDAEALALLADGAVATFDRDDDVAAVTVVDVETRRPAAGRVGLLLAEQVTPLSPRARQWFVLSAIAVLLGAALAALLLSTRFVAPIRSIEATTRRLADGDLSARVDVPGDDEVAELGRSVNTMAADLERSRQLEQQFLLSVSHDLRTPLTAIRGYGEALADGAVPDTARAGEVIVGQSDRLGRLVADLLQLARLDARQFGLDTAPIDLGEAVARHVDAVRPTAATHDLTLTVDAEPGVRVEADADRVGQMVSNLVENAVKYAATTIVVSVRTIDGHGVVAVTDDGAGIPEADLAHVFERLYVTQARPVREEQSSGLGLAIVAQLAAAMGGGVAAHSPVDDGRGTSVGFRIPLI